MNRLDRVDCSQAAPVHGRGANTHGVFHRHADVIGLILSLLLLATAIVLVGYRLFAGITTVGMTGVDTFDYWRVANDFLHGHYDSEYHRLSFYALNALALKLLG